MFWFYYIILCYFFINVAQTNDIVRTIQPKRCIPVKPIKLTCKDPNEEFVQKKLTCPPDLCVSLVARYDCSTALPPKPGCQCKAGYLRLNKTSRCVPTCKCPQMAHSPQCQPQTCKDPNEEFLQEKSTCPPDLCESIVSKYDCTKAPPPKPGCRCKSGYLRHNETSNCVPICQCPQLASSPECQRQTCKDPNEEFVQEKSTCPPDTCNALVARYNCTNAPSPKPGCTCKSGYRRLDKTGICVPICECPEMANSPECQIKTCKDPNEEFLQEKSTCPPDLCESIVSDYDCRKAPPPKPGCRCKSGYLRYNETSNCVPICQCPQLASSAECQPQTCKDPNEEFLQEKSTCPPDLCESIVSKYDCTKAPPPKPGCRCKSGYLRHNETSNCVPICQCPQLASSPECQPQTCKDPNEEFVQEKSTCPPDTCNALVARYNCTNASSKPGCTCKSGYRRLDKTGICVPICECPEMANSPECQPQTCKDPYEEFLQEKLTCPPDLCESIVSKYDCTKAPPPKPGCRCKSGYLRHNETSNCVPICQCPQLASSPECQPQTCKDPNEEFVQEKSTCPPDTCNALVARYNCTNAPSPKPGCTCKSGYRRLDKTGICVPICECPEMANAPECQIKTCKDPNEEFLQEKSTCPPDLCISIVARFNCTKAPPPKPGCRCKSGYLRYNETSNCVPICQCPQLASSPECQPQKCKDPNEEFVQEKSTCPPDTCNALVARYNCTNAPSPKPGCTCKSGYRRLDKTGICVPICKCPEMAYSPECQPQTCKDPNEEFLQEKSTCPPDLCESIVSKYDCTKAPPPKPGCRCKSGYLRHNATSNCVPICQCPQLAFSPECQPQTCKDPNEEFVQEKSTCPPDTCNALVARYNCTNASFKPGCTCKSGYRRLDKTGICVPICECPEMANSPECQPQTCKDPYEEFLQEKLTCPPDLCESIVSKYDCTKAPPPKPGCRCKSGYLRYNETSNCVPICQCPQLASSPECQPQTCKDPNEEFVQEKSTCPPDTCNALVARYNCTNAPSPKPGCTCKSGYRRLDKTGICVPICECPEMANSPECQIKTCKDPNEEFLEEKSTCPPDLCESIVSKYDCTKAPPPKPGCRCKSGYLRYNKTSNCVPICQCPELASSPECQPQTCKDPNEEFVQEKSTCPPDTCNALVARYNCTNASSKSGCTCKSGYRRLDKTGICVPICECPEMANSPECQPQTCKDPNEEFLQEKSTCPPDLCESIVSKYDCTKAPPPKPGCRCKSGYLRHNETSNCVPICQCPQLASSPECQPQTCKDPNEVFVQEKSTCVPDTCISLVARYNCINAPPPKPGCTCKSGYKRLTKTGSCVPICQCPQIAYSLDCQQQTCKDPNEEFVLEKPTSDTCKALVAKEECRNEATPKPGCTCKSGYRRNDTRYCVPICECPEMANSPECEDQTCEDYSY